MTVVIGLVTDEGVWMASDGVGNLGDNLTIHFVKDKIHSFNVDRSEATGRVSATETLLVGTGGAYLVGQFIEHEWTPGSWPRGMPAEVFVRRCAAEWFDLFERDEHTWARVRDIQPPELLSKELLDGVLLIGFAGRLWTLMPDSSMSEMREDYAALGCAMETAMGAMYVSNGCDPQARLTDALAACEYHHADIGGPFLVKFAPYRKEK